MTHYHIAVLDSTKSYAKLLAKKTQETDYVIYNHKEGDKVLCLYEPHAYPDKIQSLLHCLNASDTALWVISAVDADFGEITLALMQAGKKDGFIILKDVDEAQVKAILSKTPMAAWPLLSADLSAVELKAKLMEKEPVYSQSPKRVLVDACFEVRGVGTVVLGKAEAGEISVHDNLELFPGKTHLSVKSIQVQDEDIQKAELGSRVGLSLKGASPDSVKRGCYLAESASMKSFTKGEAELVLSPFAKEGIESGTELFFSYGLQYVAAKLELSSPLAAGSKSVVKFSLLLPMAALEGARFLVVRANKRPRIIGYGVFKAVQ
ncbi:Elongation factor 1-alpha [uncultured archaeon]|nr:Elongation factor 1-alpha [uncultured archaeon]